MSSFRLKKLRGGKDKKLLPHDVVSEILSWLPPDKLVKFSIVCKAWYSTIRDTRFFLELHKSHYASNLRNNIHTMIFARKDFIKLSLVHDSCPEKVLYDIIDLTKFHTIMKSYCDRVEVDPLHLDTDLCKSYFIKGSCNGLICWANHLVDFAPILLCNPSIRLTTLVPPFRLLKKNMPVYSSIYYSYGVGFDRVSLDYKVIKFISGNMDYSRYGPGRDVSSDIFLRRPNSRGRAAIYSLKSKSWKKIVKPRIPPYDPEGQSSLFLHGFIHWLAYAPKEFKIILFDVCNNVFCHEMLETPPEINLPGRLITIHMVNDSLCLFDNPYYFDYINSIDDEICHIWMMKEYRVTESWVKQLSIAPKNRIGRCIKPTIGGKFLFAKHPFHQFTLHDPEADDEDKDIDPATHEEMWPNICSLAPTLEFLSVN